MPTSLQSLTAQAPTGRPRPVLFDHDDYTTAILRQGSAIPWSDLALLSGHVGQVHSLLEPDAVWVDVEAFYDAALQDAPALVAALAARSRTGYALRALLADPELVERLAQTLVVLSDACRRPVVIDVPSPARWLSRAHAVAGTPLEEVTTDSADSASMYLAEWLGKLGSPKVGLVLLDGRAAVGDARLEADEVLADYSSVLNVAHHYGWSVALRTEAGVQAGEGEPSIGVLPEQWWAGGNDVPAGDVLLGTIPPDAAPETVLDEIARLR